jgi:hypothetical protein
VLKTSMHSSLCQEVQSLCLSAVSNNCVRSLVYPSPFSDTRLLDWVKQREPPSVSIVIHELDITRLTSPPRVDGIFVCYDSGDVSSFAPVSNFLRASNVMLWFVLILTVHFKD